MRLGAEGCDEEGGTATQIQIHYFAIGGNAANSSHQHNMGTAEETNATKPATTRHQNIHNLPLKEHLKLLAAFKQLRTCVQDGGPGVMHSTSAELGEDVPPPYSKEDDHANQATSSSSGSPQQQQQSSATGTSLPPQLDDTSNADKEARWTELLTRALIRFDRWLHLLIADASRGQAPRMQLTDLHLEPFKEHPIKDKGPFLSAAPLPARLLPPLDVALIWHCYMLNPARFIDDSMRIDHLRVLAGFQFPMRDVAAKLVHTENGFEYQVPHETIGLFEMKLQMPFDPFAAMRVSTSVLVDCPSPTCTGRTSMDYSELTRNPDWSTKCECCLQQINNNTCKGGRLFSDLESWCASTDMDRSGFRLRGGTFSPRDARPFFKDPFNPLLDRLFANKRTRTPLNADLHNVATWTPDEDVLGIIKSGNRSPGEIFSTSLDIIHMADVLRNAAVQVVPTKLFSATKRLEIVRVRTDMLMRYYIDSHPLTDFSLDLITAARRQESFIDEMKHLGWLDDGPSNDDLQNAMTRYKKWLRLLSLYPSYFLSPTLDIDLIWHTHQLSHVYYTDCYLILGRFLDHDDRVEKGDLKLAFQKTTDLWRKQYKQPYSLCGCCRHDSTFYRVTDTIKAKLKVKGKSKDAEAHDVIVNSRDRPDHPSVHNAVNIVGYTEEDTAKDEKKVTATATAHENAFG